MKNRILEISPGAILFFGFLIYLDPFRLALPFASACACHELGHLLAVKLAGGRIEQFSIRTLGAEIRAECPTYGRDAMATASGPLVNLMLAVLLPSPMWELQLLLGCFNLLPLPSLDGGRLLRLLLLRRCEPQRTERIMELTNRLLGTTAWILGAYGTLLMRWGLWPLTLGACVAMRAFLAAGDEKSII